MCQIRILSKKCQKCLGNFPPEVSVSRCQKAVDKKVKKCDWADCYEVAALAVGNWRDCKKCWVKYEAERETEACVVAASEVIVGYCI
ncbi:hypothetical protein BFJ63_vAg11056 [Fusarium oxysporum f. sp. narcissi]|uniref:Uncharacterized protein n=2 Tax=Fusarium oxysporum TaxID=5507 RepID=A0A4Q2VIM3_FUSOX|nr:hypothetical protein BFJ65_g16242 [Fusarium oxysporum f. sp. cepae]RKK31397.1 hypothetical protein BFJ66_g15876 [Fusarium oxysporum f. sp. cepae]RKK31701.1 hypothetical protein BFJ67_g15101 [Fusarium oxysporum f. sp. cepae]RYC86028.1 hypothetical protein BFJ63_vAg11056 [Fusarium oxysporum f. sp. narcissi]